MKHSYKRRHFETPVLGMKYFFRNYRGLRYYYHHHRRRHRHQRQKFLGVFIQWTLIFSLFNSLTVETANVRNCPGMEVLVSSAAHGGFGATTPCVPIIKLAQKLVAVYRDASCPSLLHIIVLYIWRLLVSKQRAFTWGVKAEMSVCFRFLFPCVFSQAQKRARKPTAMIYCTRSPLRFSYGERMWDPSVSPPAESGFGYWWVAMTLSQTSGSEMSGLSSNHVREIQRWLPRRRCWILQHLPAPPASRDGENRAYDAQAVLRGSQVSTDLGFFRAPCILVDGKSWGWGCTRVLQVGHRRTGP